MNLLPVAQYLEDNQFGVQGQSIFINQLPLEAPGGILLRSPLQGTPINYYLPGYYKTKFQLVIRAAGYAAGEQNAEDVIAALTLSQQQIGTMFFNYMRPTTIPIAYQLSKGNLIEFSTFMDVCFTQ